MRATVPAIDRFNAKTAPGPNGCIQWRSAKSQQGYGWFSWQSKAVLAHRWAYEAANGPIPVKGVIDHLCRNRACVNPDHLQCVTMAENTRRGVLHDEQRARAKRQTLCKRGHPMFGPNVSVNPKGHRCCKTCQRAAAAAWKILHRERVNHMQQLRRAAL